MQIGQGESLVQFFVSGFAKSLLSYRSSDEQRAGWLISNALFAEVAKKRFWDCSKGIFKRRCFRQDCPEVERAASLLRWTHG